MRKAFKNQYTKINEDKTINEIEQLVVRRMKATQFFKEYKEGIVESVVFVIPTDQGYMPFKLPARVEQVKKKIYGTTDISDSQKDQARRTAWRNVKDWIDAQLALIETDQVKTVEIFLPYMTNAQGKTVYEDMSDRGFKLPSGNE